MKLRSNCFPHKCLKLFHMFNFICIILSIAEDLGVMIFSILQRQSCYNPYFNKTASSFSFVALQKRERVDHCKLMKTLVDEEKALLSIHLNLI